MTPNKRANIKWESTCHKILLISKFYGHEITFADLQTINSKHFKYFGNIKREMLRLELSSYIVYTNKNKTSWRITNAGVAYLYDLAKVNRIKHPIAGD